MPLPTVSNCSCVYAKVIHFALKICFRNYNCGVTAVYKLLSRSLILETILKVVTIGLQSHLYMTT